MFRKIVFIPFILLMPIIMVACGFDDKIKDVELMGAGDTMHDSFTFVNLGVEITETNDNVYTVSGSVEKIENAEIKQEFDIDEDVEHVVVVKVSANGRVVNEQEVDIRVNGLRSYDAEHLNGKDYTFIILEAVAGEVVSIDVTWSKDENVNYIIKFDEKIILK